MANERLVLEKIKRLVAARRYLVKNHAHLHSIEEGFSESDMMEALAGKCRILEHYPEVSRCLILGYFMISTNVRVPLHLICDYSQDERIDFVTAYIPQKPWWLTPTIRGKKHDR
ncbi:MAG TPA: hypothetical protein VFZ34_00220 [Blastocatellia bacterium]|nr:hypothetical protein [Blastocatellia bacterium]